MPGIKEAAPPTEAAGNITVSDKELHPAWDSFKKFGVTMGVNFLTGTDWLGPWIYFKAGWELKQ